ncbi:ribosome biogenesis protein Nop16 [Mycotypha africana]|uniref:ribosome biogenesis protein Nop16 n=1 Tax=Mycotypha africana TaxID=64632 RepID=UPI002301CDDC|nr:ribosome biogenesis protein Nop16 [Mycotypha africana]KAI8968557.1 ribosome biogenesis protein Nop16 [Mycotypha africana]
MGTVLQKRAARRTKKNTRRTADRHKKRVTIVGNPIIKKNWDKKLTVKQNYEKLGLLTELNGSTGGKEKLNPDNKDKTEESEDMEDDATPMKALVDLTDAEVEELKKKLAPGEGLIQRDEEGNILRVIVGEKKSHDDILDEEIAPVEAKTDVVRQLEEQAANAFHHEKYQSEFQTDWIQKLINKHGDDYKAMFWDKELNIYQNTAAQLKKKCQQYLKK